MTQKNWFIVKDPHLEITKEWEQLSEKVLGSQVHPQRMKDFILSRMALKKALENKGLNLSPQELIVEDYCRLKDYPQILLSLSHTKDSGGAFVEMRSQFKTLGFDLEEKSRVVKEEIFKKISHPLDIKKHPLETWCLKEAIFKAIVNTQKKLPSPEFSSLIIQKDFWEHRDLKLRGQWELQDEISLIVGLAYEES